MMILNYSSLLWAVREVFSANCVASASVALPVILKFSRSSHDVYSLFSCWGEGKIWFTLTIYSTIWNIIHPSLLILLWKQFTQTTFVPFYCITHNYAYLFIDNNRSTHSFHIFFHLITHLFNYSFLQGLMTETSI